MRARKFFVLFLFVVPVLVEYACSHRGSGNESKAQAEDQQIPDRVSYNFNIRPILSDKCFKCHGPDANKREAGLRLDLPESAFKALKDHAGAHNFPLVAGDPSKSQVFYRISTSDTTEMMPPAGSNLKHLTPYEIALVKKWIEEGAKYEKHWAFVVPKEPVLPPVKLKSWPTNEIDRFVLNKMEQKGLEPNSPADPERLLKRVSLDLTGLLPTMDQMTRFAADHRPTAYEKMVDQLIASPAYGEKMALQWLDVARYADSHGFQDDNYRTQWPWRDWVIHAFNENLPYNTFATWQLAGDLLPNATKEQVLATGFNRNHKITEEGGVIDEEYRVQYVTDRTNTFGKAFMGVTVECAHCHDHKYDPISQKEYYQLFAYFNNVKEYGIESLVGGPETYAKHPLIKISDSDLRGMLKFIHKKDTAGLIVSVMGDSARVRPTYILRRGNYDAHGDEVQPGTPAAMGPDSKNLPKNRLGLVEWLFDKDNPLAARVFVNRMWQEIFGKGIVKSAGDFGMQGDLPTNPELLNWLAIDFMKHGWDMKRLMKQLVMSATYRQSTVLSPEKAAVDPENTYLTRGPRNRLPAELVRDVVLQSSGLLNRDIGGPSVKPYQPPGLWEMATSGRGLLANYKQSHGADLYRRGMYTFIKRTVPPASSAIFDASNRDQCEVRRLHTNTPLQALVMENDPTVLEASRVLGARLLLGNPKASGDAILAKVFHLILCRLPKPRELAILHTYYRDQLATMTAGNAARLLAIGEYPLPREFETKAGEDQQPVITRRRELAALMKVIDAVYNLEETITKS